MKPRLIPIPNKDYSAWEYEDQTKIKHKALATYFKIWVSKLGKYSDTMFFDCHAGCGAYINMDTKEISFGSSFIVDEIAEAINAKRAHNNYICASEIDDETLDNFKAVMLDKGTQRISAKHGDFQQIMLDDKVKKYYSSHPTLFLVDPFGYSMKMANMSLMMENYKNEIIINFMFDYINRFLSACNPQLLDEFFGCHEWINANGLTGFERENFLIELYKRQLKLATNARYVFAYKLQFPSKHKTYYYLVHATNHIDGITFMKNSFASVNNGRVDYLGRDNNSIMLFDLTSFKTEEFVRKAFKPYASQTITFKNLWEQIAESIPYTDADLADALKELENINKVNVTRVSSKRGRYHNDDIIIFGANI